MQLAFIIESMSHSGGGAEREIARITDYFAGMKWDIVLLSFDPEHSASFYPLNPLVNWIRLSRPQKTRAKFLKFIPGQFLKRLFVIRNYLKNVKPDLVISFMNVTNLYSLIASKSLNLPVIISDRNNPKEKPLPYRWKVLQNLVYPFADKLVILTQQQTFCYTKTIQKIIEPISISVSIKNEEKTSLPFKKPFILGVGRLNKQKGFDILIRAFGKISNQYPEWNLIILGDGQERAALETLITELKYTEKILLPGYVNHPHACMKEADIFIFPSRYEGFGNAFLEAMACGCPVIATSCDFGPKEVIKSGENGILVEKENPEIMANALEMLINDETLRKKLGENAKKVQEDYSIQKVLMKWKALIHKVLDIT